MHTLGFMHEQMRPDAAKYVKIYEDRIQNLQILNYKPLPNDDWLQAKRNYSQMFPYDYMSILQYGSGKKPFDIEKINDTPIQTNYDLSAIDADELNYFYNCEFVFNSSSNLNIPYQDQFCYRVENGSEMIETCVQRVDTYFAQSFDRMDPEFTTRILGEKHWHLNFGKTPSKISDKESHMNYYLHMGDSRYSYHIDAPNSHFIRIHQLPPIYFPAGVNFCLAFNYKLWGNGISTLEVGENVNSTWYQIANFSRNADEDETSEWKAAVIYRSSNDSGQNITFEFGGEIKKGGNIAVDNITVFNCAFDISYLTNRSLSEQLNDGTVLGLSLISNSYVAQFLSNERKEIEKIIDCCKILINGTVFTMYECIATRGQLEVFCQIDPPEKEMSQIDFERCCK
ncbi:hypothetical protein B4U79_16704 [Dinothrombium tinctorium]|uniref:Metalloendopeptidase n=1 Tax=Dinothrombium tinctorium TaxID=1965070 RepID=A0A443QF53_9ACAR|nr:hypothetical protein B4U79_16704 [Dinothrombium tinctorium]